MEYNLIQEPALLLLCGLPFAGKTIFSSQLAAHYHWKYLSLDNINTEFKHGAQENTISPAEWAKTYTEAYRRVAYYLQQRITVIYDETNFLREQRDKLREIASKYRLPTYVIYVSTPVATVRQRWQTNRTTQQRNDVRDDDFELVVRRFQPPDVDENVIEYNTEMSISQWIKKHLEQ